MRDWAACAPLTMASKRSGESVPAGPRGGGLDRGLDARQLRLEARDGLAEDTEGLVEPGHVASDPARRDEEDDLDRVAAADAVEASHALLDDERAPGQVEEHDAPAELEVAALAAALGRDEQARARRRAELGDLDVAACGREAFVEGPGRELGALAERRAHELERLAVRDEDERLLARGSPRGGVRGEPEAGADRGIGLAGQQPEIVLAAAERRQEGGARGERSADAVGLLPPAEGVLGLRLSHRLDERQARSARRPRRAAIATPTRGRQPADVDAPRRAGAGGQRLLACEALPRSPRSRGSRRGAAAGAGGRSRGRRRPAVSR